VVRGKAKKCVKQNGGGSGKCVHPLHLCLSWLVCELQFNSTFEEPQKSENGKIGRFIYDCSEYLSHVTLKVG